MLSILAALLGTAFVGVNFTGSDDEDTIFGTQLDDTIDGGEGSDFIAGDDGDDIVRGGADGDTVYAGDGDDIITDSAGRDELYGGAGHDVIIDTNSGDDDPEFEGSLDVLSGGEGNDFLYKTTGRGTVLDGGAGDDILVSDEFFTTYTGGEGSDYFVATTDLATTSIFPRPVYGTATDFNPAEDVLVVRLDEGENPTAFEFRERLGRLELFTDNVYGGNTHMAFDGLGLGDITYEDIAFIQEDDAQAFYDSQGASGPVLVPEEDTGPVVFNGTEGDDTFSSYNGDTVQYGNGGADALGSLYGDATIEGGAGNDTITTGYGTQWVDGGTGDDRIVHQSYGVLRNDAGDDTIFGGAGHDTITAYGGDTYVDGGEGDDVIRVTERLNSASAAGASEVFGGLGDDVITSFVTEGNLDGGEGNDTLRVSDGEATLTGGLGADVVEIGVGIDGAVTVTDYDAAEDSLVVDVPAGTALGDVPVTFEQIGGDLYVYVARDDAGEAPELVAVLDGIEAARVTLSNGTETRDIDFDGGPVETNVPTEGDDILTGTTGNDIINPLGGDDRVDALAGDDTLRPSAGNDLLIGGAGNDVLIDSEGDDTLMGGEGDDRLFVSSGDDVADGGAGNDAVSFQSAFGTALGGAGDDLVIGNGGTYSGNNTDVIFRGNEGNDTLISGRSDGDVALYGDEGADELREALLYDGGVYDPNTSRTYTYFTFANDGELYDGGDGNDTILTAAGNDTVFGGAGDDVIHVANSVLITGGEGADEIIIDNGRPTNDAYVLSSPTSILNDNGGAGVGTITDYTRGEDTVVIQLGSIADPTEDMLSFEQVGDDLNVYLGNDASAPVVAVLQGVDNADITLSGTSSSITVAHEAEVVGGPVSTVPSDGDDLLGGGAGDDFIQGYGGDDTLDGGAGENYLRGGEGDDLLISSGSDDMTGGAGADTYLIGGGDHASIYDFDPVEDQIVIQLDAGEALADVQFHYDGNDTFVTLNGVTEAVIYGTAPSQIGASGIIGIEASRVPDFIANHGA